MPTFIALLRGINVGGHKLVSMSDLRELLTNLGFEDVRSLLQSGNLVFRTGKKNSAALEALLEREAGKHLGLDASIFVRSAEEWKTIIARNPFAEQAKRDPGHTIAMFLKDAPAQVDVQALQAAIQGREIVRADGRQLYLIYPDGMGRSKLTNALIERKLGTRGTARNWNTVLKLDEKG